MQNESRENRNCLLDFPLKWYFLLSLLPVFDSSYACFLIHLNFLFRTQVRLFEKAIETESNYLLTNGKVTTHALSCLCRHFADLSSGLTKM